jgi:hypothetical protein
MRFLDGTILPLLEADFGRFETQNRNSESKKSSPKAAKIPIVQLYFSYKIIIYLFTITYKMLYTPFVQLQNLHMSKKSSTFAPDFETRFTMQN